MRSEVPRRRVTLSAAELQVALMFSLILLDLSFSEVVSDIPLDAGTLVVVVLFALFGGSVWFGSRSRSERSTGTGSPRSSVEGREEGEKQRDPAAR